MSNILDFSIATSKQIEATICEQLVNIRLSRNFTQAQLAKAAGVSTKTITNLEDGKSISFDTFIRVLKGLGLQSNLEGFLPDPTIRPVERVQMRGFERKRVRQVFKKKPKTKWTWGDES
jgi:transcriptional regulator with XRE-family HTH domain